jgi:hypothetical protein
MLAAASASRIDVVGVGAADEDRRLAARPAGLHDVEAGNERQCVGDGTVLMAFDVPGGDDRR